MLRPGWVQQQCFESSPPPKAGAASEVECAEQQAAVVIQAAGRGYMTRQKTRKRSKQMPRTHRREVTEALGEQRRVLGFKGLVV